MATFITCNNKDSVPLDALILALFGKDTTTGKFYLRKIKLDVSNQANQVPAASCSGEITSWETALRAAIEFDADGNVALNEGYATP